MKPRTEARRLFFTRLLHTADDLMLSATATHLSWEVAAPA